VVYPNGTSIQNLENQVLILISPQTLPAGEVGAAYNATFTATGGSGALLCAVSGVAWLPRD